MASNSLKNPQQIGAEARVTFLDATAKKERLAKGYRHSVLDEALRSARNRKEAKILEKSPVRSPKLLAHDIFSITMERIVGERLRDTLTHENAAHYAQALGRMIKTLHAANLVHNDLTTSNILVETKTDELVLIDFGLARTTKRFEDKAVDLHVLREAMEGTHPLVLQEFWTHFAKAYSDETVLQHLETVERRGRNKAKF